MENKVRFNLKNVHYAKLTATDGTNGTTYTFGTPVKVPGAVSLDLKAQGELKKEYADGIVYWKSYSNNGYEGDLEMERFPDAMLADIWGHTLGSTSKVLTEKANGEPASFALLFQIDGDEDADYYVMYNCMGSRPGISSKTNEGNKAPQHQTSTISCTPMEDDYSVFARTTHETPVATKNGWFSAVFREGA